mgnify:CR=1 FL=1
MGLTLQQLNELLQGELIGQDDGRIISGINTLRDASSSDICIVMQKRFVSEALASQAACLVVSQEIEDLKCPQLLVKNSRKAYYQLATFFAKKSIVIDEISKKSSIHESATISEGVSVGPYSVVEASVSIGHNSHIGSNVTIGEGVVIGDSCQVHAGVVIYPGVVIGNRVVIKSNASVGSEGFGFYQDQEGYHKIPQLGGLCIEDDVEIGCNTTIDRGALGDSIVGKGTKLDNLVHLAHNITIGKNCAIASQVGFAGSVEIGDNVQIAGQVGLSNQVSIGSNSVVFGKSGVTKSFDEGSFISGIPARSHAQELKNQARLKKLLK